MHYFAQLLTEVLEHPEARTWVLDRVFTDDTVGPTLVRPLRRLADQADSERLAEYLIGGILKGELAAVTANSLRWELMSRDDFLLTPLPNHLFQRDNSAWIYGGVSINPMAMPARMRESVHSAAIYRFHPMFAEEGSSLVRRRRPAPPARHARGRRHPRARRRGRDDRAG